MKIMFRDFFNKFVADEFDVKVDLKINYVRREGLGDR